MLSVSLVHAAGHSGAIPITAFCVEQGRAGRGAAPRMRRPSRARPPTSRRRRRGSPSRAGAGRGRGRRGPGDHGRAEAAAETRGRASERKVWEEVARVQRDLSSKLAAEVASPQSTSSLQLALENDKLQQAQHDYVAALQGAGEQESDIVGYAFAVDGKLDSAEIYPSNALFRKMWPTLLTANATEAIASRGGAATTAPSSADVAAFLKAAESGTASRQPLTHAAELETRRSKQAVYLETRRADGSWVHRGYVAN